jgi:glycosyltransferase involved in cell wall biosynthesis
MKRLFYLCLFILSGTLALFTSEEPIKFTKVISSYTFQCAHFSPDAKKNKPYPSRNSLFPEEKNHNTCEKLPRNTIIKEPTAPIKKILFIMPALLLGGTEWAFLNMINTLQLPSNSYELCIMKRGGILEQFLKKDIKIISWEEAQAKTFDIAVSYAHWVPPTLWAEKIHARRKIQWIHTDMKNVGWIPKINKAWLDVDTYVLVSEGSKKSFDETCPALSGRSLVVHNFIDNDRIRTQAEEAIHDMKTNDRLLNVVSVCRLNRVKGLDRAIKAMKQLKDKGILFRWYVVGEGVERENLERLIRKYHLQDNFILLSSRLNPFPYLKKADIFVLPSRSEAFPLSCIEAKVLACPIIITKVSSANELIISGTNGLIVENDTEGLYKGLKLLLTKRHVREKFAKNLQGYEYDNSKSLEEVRKIFF